MSGTDYEEIPVAFPIVDISQLNRYSDRYLVLMLVATAPILLFAGYGDIFFLAPIFFIFGPTWVISRLNNILVRISISRYGVGNGGPQGSKQDGGGNGEPPPPNSQSLLRILILLLTLCVLYIGFTFAWAGWPATFYSDQNWIVFGFCSSLAWAVGSQGGPLVFSNVANTLAAMFAAWSLGYSIGPNYCSGSNALYIPSSEFLMRGACRLMLFFRDSTH